MSAQDRDGRSKKDSKAKKESKKKGKHKHKDKDKDKDKGKGDKSAGLITGAQVGLGAPTAFGARSVITADEDNAIVSVAYKCCSVACYAHRILCASSTSS